MGEITVVDIGQLQKIFFEITFILMIIRNNANNIWKQEMTEKTFTS